MMSAFLSLQSITRQWDGEGGVVNVSLDVEKGAFLSILGPSGCGKSTLLRLIAGLEHPQTGSIIMDGQDVTEQNASERHLSMVFQSYALFPHLNVTENIQFGLKVRKVSKTERAERVAEAVEMTGLKGLELRKPAELSGGQRQRVALARASVSGHPLCLMDEPLSNLDAKLRHSVRRDIKALQRRLGLTVVYVTHDQSEAMSLSDQVALMNGGHLEQIGTPAELYNKPASLFAAEFIGEPPMAHLAGELLGLNDQIRVGIRPEFISMEADARSADVSAQVTDIEFLGSGTRYNLDLPSTKGLTVTAPGEATIAMGEQVHISLPENKRLLFDAASGKIKKEPTQNYETDSRQTTVS
ncbi:ABC transporter ATP-binding protein [Cohaesibacter gelatinilyticus]|nr:ABC transporter ATP-binding protein [Cohaesibacter gelatinilyticus]